ncbi:MAG: tetratricopeptide repeat protein [Candidatus Omnitrophota bacterium]
MNSALHNRPRRIVLIALLFLATSVGLAQECPDADKDIAAATERIRKKDKDLWAALEKLEQAYFCKKDHEGLYEYLKGCLKAGYAKSPEIYYMMARARHEGILYWQASKNWEGIYDQAPAYRRDISENLDKAEKFTKNNALLLCRIRYLRWRNISGEGPENASELFNDVVQTAGSLSASPDVLATIKAMADDMSTLEDKNPARRLYEIYVEKLTASDLPAEELKAKAEEFLSAGNVYLAKALFEHYVGQFSQDAQAQGKELVAVADRFVHTGWKEGADPFYAESLYVKAHGLAADAAFDSASQYRRSYNLERLKEYERAIEEYQKLLQIYPDYEPKQKIIFRLGVLTTLGCRDVAQGVDYFTKTKDEFPNDLLALSSLYQLGLLSQWNKDNTKAKEYYTALLKAAEAQGLDMEKEELVLLAQTRLKEIDEIKEMRYALKLFLDGAAGGIAVDLTVRPAKQDPKQSVNFVVTTSNPQTGCMTPDFAYEWSGEVGGLENIPNSPELPTSFASKGIKVTQVAVVGPDGPQGVAFEMTEVLD